MLGKERCYPAGELPAALSPEPGNIWEGGKVSSSEIQFSLMINHMFVMQKNGLEEKPQDFSHGLKS